VASFRRLFRKQPWAFIYFAVAFGGLQYAISGVSVTGAVIGGLFFALAMSLWLALRERRKRQV
jgi:hypothetical protein